MPAERQVRGLYGARLWERDTAPTAQFLTDVLGFTRLGQEGRLDPLRLSAGDRLRRRSGDANARRGAWGVGSVHHLAWRVDDEAHQQRVRSDVESGGAQPTPVIDRFWFKSVYFKEPGGVLFEIATDGPGFTVDEELGHLGEALVLPPFLEHHRREIEAVLPPLKTSDAGDAGVVMDSEPLDFVHVFEPPADHSQPTVLVLHGTGGNEHDLVPLGHALWPGAGILSPRGKSWNAGCLASSSGLRRASSTWTISNNGRTSSRTS